VTDRHPRFGAVRPLIPGEAAMTQTPFDHPPPVRDLSAGLWWAAGEALLSLGLLLAVRLLNLA
jgi:hypothetical protein